METISLSVAGSVVGALVAAVGIMWKLLTGTAQSRDKECKARVSALETKVTEIYTMMAKRADIEITKAEKREQQAMEQAVKIAVVLEGVGELTRHTIRILRRHEPGFDHTLAQKSYEQAVDRYKPSQEKKLSGETVPSYEQKTSDETSRFVKGGKQQ